MISIVSSEFGPLNLTTITVKGVSAALEKHTPKGETKGIKAYFKMDESGLLKIEKVGDYSIFFIRCGIWSVKLLVSRNLVWNALKNSWIFSLQAT